MTVGASPPAPGPDTLRTALSFGDEQAGRVVLRGRDLAAIAEDCGYEEVVAILWADVVDVAVDPATLGMAREAAFAALAPFEPVVRGRSAAAAMRVLMAAASFGPGAAPVGLVAWTGVAAALAMRSARSLDWARPDPARGHAADLLALATGGSPDARAARALERYMIAMIDHGISASTYAARIAASTGAAIPAAALAALCVLEGPSHGGAPALVLDQLDRIAGPDDVPGFVARERAAGRRLMGFGSRAYRGEDLRSAMMRREWLAIGGDRGARSAAQAIEAALVAELGRALPERGLRANVEFYAALLLEAVGLPRGGFTPMFAAARSAGWVAHAAEQCAQGRMIRPESRYVGVPLSPGKTS